MARRISNEGKWGTTTSAPTAANINTVLTTVNTDNYPATIAGQMDRIGDAHEIIQAKAYSMLLNVQASQGDSKPSSNTRLQKDGTHQIMDTASAINSINVQTRLLKAGSSYVSANTTTLSPGTTYTIPVGYNTTALTVQLPTLAGDAVASQVLVGKKFYNSSYTIQTGTMPNNGAVSESVGLNGSYTIPEGYHNGEGSVSGPQVNLRDVTSLASANGGLAVNSTNATATIEINRYKNPDNSEGNVARSVTIPAGYYAEDITLTPTFKDNANEVESILNYADLAVSGTLTFTNNNRVFYPKEDNGVDYYGNVTIPKAALSVQSNGTAKVTTSGWVNANDVYGTAYGGYSASATHTLTARTDNKFGTGSAIASGNITTLTSQYYTDVVAKGHTDGETKYLKVRDGVLSVDCITDKSSGVCQPSITKNSVTNVASSAATTTKPGSGYYVAVGSAANTTTVKATASVVVDVDGWVNSDDEASTDYSFTAGASASQTTYIPITASTISAGITGTAKVTPTIVADTTITQGPAGATAMTNATVSTDAPSSGYYFRIVTEAASNNITPTWSATAGYTPETSGSGTAVAVGANASDVHYVKIPKANLNSVTATKDQANNKLAFSGGKSSSAGYIAQGAAQTIPTDIAGWDGTTSVFATTGNNQVYSNAITAGSQDLYIKQGVYLTKDIKINKVSAGVGKITSAHTIQDIAYNSSTNKAVTTYGPSTDADSENTPTYFSSVEVDVTDIVKALMAI